MSIYAARFIFLGIFRSFGGVWICVIPRLCLTWGFYHYPAIVGGLFWSVSFFATGQLVGLTSLFTCSPSSLYGLPWSSAGKESASNAGDPGSIPGSGRSPGEGNDNPLQYPCQDNLLDRPVGYSSWGCIRHDGSNLAHTFACYNRCKREIFVQRKPI